jgi:hypothetical protein
MKPLHCFLLLLLSCTPLMVCAEDGPPIDVDVFYSKEDAHWAAAEKKIDAVQKQFPRLRINKVSIDDDAGYKQLAEKEKMFGVREHGDLLILLGPIPLVSKGEARHAENRFGPVVARVLNPSAGKGRLVFPVEAFAHEHFGKDATLRPYCELNDGEVLVQEVLNNGARSGFVVDAYVPIHCPTCNDTQFALALTPDLKIKAIRAVREIELYGAPMDEAESAAFLKQFIGRGPTQKPERVDGITGATKTTSSYENAVLDFLNTLKERLKQ